VLKNPLSDIAPHAIAYMFYHCAKTNKLDDDLWKTLEFQALRWWTNFNDRMFYGCFYGVLRTNKLRLQTVESLEKEFNQRCLPTLKGTQCFEFIEAISYNNRTDYDAKNYMKIHLIPRLLDTQHHLDFLHVPKQLMNLIEILDRMKYYDADLWQVVYKMLDKKTFYDVKKWKLFYDKLLYLRERGVEKESGFDFSKIIERYENQWKNTVDFQYFYNLEEKRNYTVHELIERAKDTPATMTWQEGEKYIKHKLPYWYFEKEEDRDDDVDELLDEYKFLKAREEGRIKESASSLISR